MCFTVRIVTSNCLSCKTNHFWKEVDPKREHKGSKNISFLEQTSFWTEDATTIDSHYLDFAYLE